MSLFSIVVDCCESHLFAISYYLIISSIIFYISLYNKLLYYIYFLGGQNSSFYQKAAGYEIQDFKRVRPPYYNKEIERRNPRKNKFNIFGGGLLNKKTYFL